MAPSAGLGTSLKKTREDEYSERPVRLEIFRVREESNLNREAPAQCGGIVRKLPEQKEYGDKIDKAMVKPQPEHKKEKLRSEIFVFLFFLHVYRFELCPKNVKKKQNKTKI